MRMTIRKKLLLTFLPLVLLPLTIFGLLAVRQQSTAIRDSAIEEAQAQADIIAMSIGASHLQSEGPKAPRVCRQPEQGPLGQAREA